MPTNYDDIAEQYKKAKHHPWRMHIEHYTFFRLLGDLHGKSVLDLACGEGFFTRFIKQAGASRVVGVDLSHGMIDLAQQEEKRRPLGIDYRVGDAKYLQLDETFDLVVAAYLLNYCSTAEELGQMGQVIASALKPGSRFVTVNNNPACEDFHGDKYGVAKRAAGPLQDGTPIIYTFFLAEGPFEITNYHLSQTTHEQTLAAAGLSALRWHNPELSPAGAQEYTPGYWQPFLDRPPIIFLECVKRG